jgi:hypothetical protein
MRSWNCLSTAGSNIDEGIRDIRRKASHSSERIEIERFVQVPGQVVDDALDALRIAVGIVHRAPSVTHSF